jgi:subtilisin family serine protease
MLQNVHRVAALAAACAAIFATAASAAGRPDPQLGNQWALQGDGPMGAATAWTRITGGDVTVAVVDTGVDLAHRDLASNLWTNPGEVPGNGVDDDGDGFVDDVHGADFANRDGDPTDDNGHGSNTHVDDDRVATYPVDLDAPNLVAVTSSDRRGRLAPAASYGRTSVDLAAPGEEILSTARGGGYELRSGSSMAAAQVSGAAVLLTSARPDLGWSGMRAALLGSARPTSLPVAAGRLDVAGALRRVLGAPRGRSRVSAKRASAGRLRRHVRRPRSRVAVARAAVLR